jgi:hypothetical protein
LILALALARLALAAAGPASAGAVSGKAQPDTVVFLTVSVAELPPVNSDAILKLGLQKGRVVPRVSAAPLGAGLRITLLDSVFADLSVYFGLSEMAFRHKFVVPGDVSRTRLSRPGLMTIENENSPTDRAYVYVTPTAVFAVSDSAGRYRLENVPAGKRRITAWDEKGGTKDKDVIVPAGGEVGLDFGK